ncbi:MAG: hypothetical protein ABH950_01530, partial [Candidatus Altiarchaeota archaeon]
LGGVDIIPTKENYFDGDTYDTDSDEFYTDHDDDVTTPPDYAISRMPLGVGDHGTLILRSQMDAAIRIHNSGGIDYNNKYMNMDHGSHGEVNKDHFASELAISYQPGYISPQWNWVCGDLSGEDHNHCISFNPGGSCSAFSCNTNDMVSDAESAKMIFYSGHCSGRVFGGYCEWEKDPNNVTIPTTCLGKVAGQNLMSAYNPFSDSMVYANSCRTASIWKDSVGNVMYGSESFTMNLIDYGVAVIWGQVDFGYSNNYDPYGLGPTPLSAWFDTKLYDYLQLYSLGLAEYQLKKEKIEYIYDPANGISAPSQELWAYIVYTRHLYGDPTIITNLQGRAVAPTKTSEEELRENVCGGGAFTCISEEGLPLLLTKSSISTDHLDIISLAQERAEEVYLPNWRILEDRSFEVHNALGEPFLQVVVEYDSPWGPEESILYFNAEGELTNEIVSH